MLRTPLQLETSFVSNLELKAEPWFPSEGSQPEVSTDVQLDSADDDPGLWHIRLVITFEAKPERPSAYSGELEIHGFFRFESGDLPGDQAATIVGVNGTSILYSSAREYLLLVTSRGPWAPMQLPTVSFRDMVATKPAGHNGGGRRKAVAPPKQTRKSPGARASKKRAAKPAKKRAPAKTKKAASKKKPASSKKKGTSHKKKTT